MYMYIYIHIYMYKYLAQLAVLKPPNLGKRMSTPRDVQADRMLDMGFEPQIRRIVEAGRHEGGLAWDNNPK